MRLVSEDGSSAVAAVMFDAPQTAVPTETKDALMAAFRAAPVDGVEVDFSSSIASGMPEVMGPGEAVGLVIAAIVLFVMLGTLVAAGLPLITALIGVGIGVLGAMSLSGVVEMVSVTPVLGVMLGLAVGIDYALFIVNRHRRQLMDGYTVDESIALATGTSGNAVVFAGSTVIIALLALNVTGIGFLGLMGTVGAACVAIAVLIAVTLTPALLSLVGTRVLRRRETERLAVQTGPAPVRPAAPMATRSAIARVILAVAVLGVVAVPAASMRLSLPVGSNEGAETTQHVAYDIVADKLGDGANGPLLVVADLPGSPTEAEALDYQVQVATALAAFDDVVAVAPIGTSDDRTVAAFQVLPAEGPTSVSTERLVADLRAASPLADGITLGVAGQATGNIDISQKLADALPLYLALVVGLSFVIMVVVFRSLFVPLIATGGFVLSYFAAIGGTVAIYQWGWLGPVFGVSTPAPILNFLPTILVGVLFGLAMDYMLFLASGMREAYAHGAPSRTAVVLGFRAGRSVVAAAAIIMVAVFGGFVFSDSAIIRPIGFSLAFGVLVDAFVVRMLLMPALMHLAGDRAWWLPRWLDRLIPNVDVEGAALERQHPHVGADHLDAPHGRIRGAAPRRTRATRPTPPAPPADPPDRDDDHRPGRHTDKDHTMTDTATDSVFDLTFTSSRGEAIPLATYEGRPLLVVNTASQCGFTPQYEGLQALHEAYADQGLVVIGFPCDQFAHQEPGDDAEIEEFCRVNFGVEFPLSTKVDVNGKATHPVFAFLKERAERTARLCDQVELHEVPGRPRRDDGQALQPQDEPRRDPRRHRGPARLTRRPGCYSADHRAFASIWSRCESTCAMRIWSIAQSRLGAPARGGRVGRSSCSSVSARISAAVAATCRSSWSIASRGERSVTRRARSIFGRRLEGAVPIVTRTIHRW